MIVLEDSISVFFHDTPAHDDAPPYQVWLPTGKCSTVARGLGSRFVCVANILVPAFPASLHNPVMLIIICKQKNFNKEVLRKHHV